MSSYKEFISNIRRSVSYNSAPLDDVHKIHTRDIDSIISSAQRYSSTDKDNLRFEIASVRQGDFFRRPEYVVYSYPATEYNIFDPVSNTIKNVNGEFFIRLREGSAYLMVQAPEPGGKRVNFDEVMAKIKRHPSLDITNVDENTVKEIVKRQRGKWITFANFMHDPVSDAQLEFTSSNNDMLGSIYITSPGIGGADVTGREIKKLLISNGVNFDASVNDTLIDSLDKKPVYDQWISIAEGKPAVKGQDAYIELQVSRTQKSGSSNSSVIGSKKKNGVPMLLSTVKAGDIVAKKIPAAIGEQGTTIFGDVMFAENGNDISMEGNELVQISGNDAIAIESGSVYLKKNKVCIDKVMEINSDLTLDIGNIDYPGSVIIYGDIPSEFEVKVGGNLSVFGHVAKSNLSVEGDLFVENGINGQGESRINVGGNIITKFLENTNVKVGNYCVVLDGIISSTVLCLNKLVVIEGKGRISSSTVTVQNELVVRMVGSEMGNPSHLKAVSFPEKRKEIGVLHDTIAKLVKEIESKKAFFGSNFNVTFIRDMNKKQQEQVKEILLEVKRLKYELLSTKEKLQSLRKEIAVSSNKVSIKVIDVINSEISITLNDETTMLKSKTSSIEYLFVNDRISSKMISDVSKIIEENSASVLLPHVF